MFDQVIKELNLTTPRLGVNEKYEFPCEIMNGEVYKSSSNPLPSQ